MRTTSTVQAVLDALKPAALPDYGLARLEDAHGHVVYLRPEHVSLVESKQASRVRRKWAGRLAGTMG
jgi:hypothetical protein